MNASIFKKTYSTKASAERATKRAGLSWGQSMTVQNREGRWIVENHSSSLRGNGWYDDEGDL